MEFNPFTHIFRGLNRQFPNAGGGIFEANYQCFSSAFCDKPHLEEGGKIILPPSALEKLSYLNIEFPMLFELSHVGVTPHLTHCGVLEFVADEGSCYIPHWMMEMLLLNEGDVIKVKSATLPPGNFVKFQPHSSTFLDISNPKAVLEKCLSNFSAFTKDDNIRIKYNQKNYYLRVLEVRPDNAISIVERDIEVDFAPPLDYKEPVPEAPKTSAPRPIASAPQQGEKPQDYWSSLSTGGARLSGKPISASTSPNSSKLSVPSTSPGNKYSSPSSSPQPSSSPLDSNPPRVVFGRPNQRTEPQPKKTASAPEPKKTAPSFVPFSGQGHSLKG